jgi:uncharacterized 2Fe-2S/4Fe-4S cluster protein (DUF4445 family)
LIAANPTGHLSSLTENESKRLSSEQIDSGYRLACQTKPTGNLKVSVSETVLDSKDAIGKTDIEGSYASDPMVERFIVCIPPTTSIENNISGDFLDHVSKYLKETIGHAFSFEDPDALRMLSQPASYRSEVTLVHHHERGVTAVLEGNKPRSLGAAVDIGTTTLAVYMCDLNTGEVLASGASANPQRRFGEDVISRVTYANENSEGLSFLQEVAVNELNELMARCLNEISATLDEIDEVTVVGNTTMQQSFMNIHPHGLGFSPYLPVTRNPRNFRAEEIGLDLNCGANVHVFPVISGFVGGDTLGVILSERPYEREEVSLIVDIGTNGEVVLGNKDGLWATSCATGPALEGAHIEAGMRATNGAIHKISVQPGNYRVDYEVLGDGESPPARGVCGSGIIDAVAGMLHAGVVLQSGRIKENLPGVITDEKGIGRKFILVPSEKSATGQEIAMTLSDIRQIQLAKSALSVGIKLLMRKAGVERFDRMVLTGAFGARFNWKNAVAIGMLPEVSENTEVKVVSNAAGQGAIMALLDRKLRKEIFEVSKKVQFIELAENPDFVTEFATATMFPDPINSRMND